MATYYIDPARGAENGGSSPEYPARSPGDVRVLPGDTVLFRRGSFFRGTLDNVAGAPGRPVTYGSYGEGELPVFCGSADLSDPDLWAEQSPGIWVCASVGADETGNVIFGDGAVCGTLRYRREDLLTPGDFYDECFGYRISGRSVPAGHRLYLRSDGNPGSVYGSVEAALFGRRCLAFARPHTVIENLKFINSGVHAIACGDSTVNMTVRNCVFERIGGCVWDYSRKIRYGNAVEFWNVAENILVTGCVFNDIYDSGVTHQGDAPECRPAVNMVCERNLFVKCGMAAYEQRDLMPLSASFSHNICMDAGEGFSRNGVTMPRYSEIWPRPMGHHVFLWRMEKATPGGLLVIRNNVFRNARYGAAVYSIISREAEDRTVLEGNVYYTENPDLFQRWHGTDFRSFEDYRGLEKGCRYGDPDPAGP